MKFSFAEQVNMFLIYGEV